MKQYLLILLLAITIPGASFAQRDRVAINYRGDDREASVLTVYSETGEQFFLLLNGIRQNSYPQSRVRVEQLPEYRNQLQIIFADNVTPELQQDLTIANPLDGNAASMVLCVARNREGRARLRFQMLTPVEHGYHPQPNEYIMYYGQPQQGGSAGITPVYQDAPPVPQGPIAMDDRSFADARKAIAAAEFDNTKLSTAKTILAANYVSTDQVVQLCKLFEFENNRMVFAKYAYSKTVDPNNYYKVATVFDFDSNKQALNDFITNGK